PQKSSSGGYWTDDRPIAEATRSVISRDPGKSVDRRATACAGVSSSGIAAACRKISLTGQYVWPRPYGRHRPEYTRASAERSNSSISLDLPTPASAKIV